MLAAAVNFFFPESVGVCTVGGLLTINTVLGLATVPVLAALLAALRGRPRLGLDDDDLWMEAAVIALFPMHFFFHFLAYTDTASTLLVLLGVLLAYRGRGRASAAVRASKGLGGATSKGQGARGLGRGTASKGSGADPGLTAGGPCGSCGNGR